MRRGGRVERSEKQTNEPKESKLARKPPKNNYLYRRYKDLKSMKTRLLMAKRNNLIISQHS